MRYYAVQLIVEIPETEYNNWDSHCDEVSVASRFHDPESGVYSVDYHQTTKMAFDVNRYNIFNEEGGI